VSVYGHQTNRRTWLIKALSPFLWSAPDVHLVGIQRLWGDGILHKCVYEQVVKKMNDEWQEYVLFVSAESIFQWTNSNFVTGDSIAQRERRIFGNRVR